MSEFEKGRFSGTLAALDVIIHAGQDTLAVEIIGQENVEKLIEFARKDGYWLLPELLKITKGAGLA